MKNYNLLTYKLGSNCILLLLHVTYYNKLVLVHTRLDVDILFWLNETNRRKHIFRHLELIQKLEIYECHTFPNSLSKFLLANEIRKIQKRTVLILMVVWIITNKLLFFSFPITTSSIFLSVLTKHIPTAYISRLDHRWPTMFALDKHKKLRQCLCSNLAAIPKVRQFFHLIDK